MQKKAEKHLFFAVDRTVDEYFERIIFGWRQFASLGLTFLPTFLIVYHTGRSTSAFLHRAEGTAAERLVFIARIAQQFKRLDACVVAVSIQRRLLEVVVGDRAPVEGSLTVRLRRGELGWRAADWRCRQPGRVCTQNKCKPVVGGGR